jgi:hypothetical protein
VGNEAHEQIAARVGQAHVQRRRHVAVALQQSDAPQFVLEAARGEQRAGRVEQQDLSRVLEASGSEQRVVVGGRIHTHVEPAQHRAPSLGVGVHADGREDRGAQRAPTDIHAERRHRDDFACTQPCYAVGRIHQGGPPDERGVVGDEDAARAVDEREVVDAMAAQDGREDRLEPETFGRVPERRRGFAAPGGHGKQGLAHARLVRHPAHQALLLPIDGLHGRFRAPQHVLQAIGGALAHDARDFAARPPAHQRDEGQREQRQQQDAQAFAGHRRAVREECA